MLKILSYRESSVSEYEVFSLFQTPFDIVGYSRIANPTDQATEADIRHAMGNYIAAHIFKNKSKENIPTAGVLKEANQNI